jgi:hypothetical protein
MDRAMATFQLNQLEILSLTDAGRLLLLIRWGTQPHIQLHTGRVKMWTILYLSTLGSPVRILFWRYEFTSADTKVPETADALSKSHIKCQQKDSKTARRINRDGVINTETMRLAALWV